MLGDCQYHYGVQALVEEELEYAHELSAAGVMGSSDDEVEYEQRLVREP